MGVQNFPSKVFMYIRNNIFSTGGTALKEKLAQLKKDYW